MPRKEKEVGVKKEKHYLYFVDKKGHISRCKMARGGQPGGKPEKVADAGVKKEDGRLYFVDKQGDISSSPMQRRGSRA